MFQNLKTNCVSEPTTVVVTTKQQYVNRKMVPHIVSVGMDTNNTRELTICVLVSNTQLKFINSLHSKYRHSAALIQGINTFTFQMYTQTNGHVRILYADGLYTLSCHVNSNIL